MGYQKQNFANGDVLTAAQLNHMENGIADVESTANTTKGVVDKIIDPTLSVSGKAADAAKVGEAVNAETTRAKEAEDENAKGIGQLKEDIESVTCVSPNFHDNTKDVDGFLRSDGTIVVATGFRTTGYIPAKQGDTFYFYDGNNPISARFVESYYIGNDSSINILTGYTGTYKKTYTVASKDCDYIRVSFELSNISNVMITKNPLDIYYPYGLIINNDKIVGLVNNKRNEIVIRHTNDIHDYYNKMLKAFESGNCDVFIKKGDYIYTDEFMEEIRSRSTLSRGVPIGNGCKYYFESGAKIIAKYTKADDSVYKVRHLFSPLDSCNIAGDYELYGAFVDAENTVYSIHDESAGDEKPYKRIYKNCILSHKTDTSGESLSKCIGGGSGQYGTIIIDGCSFDTVNPNTTRSPDVSYHGTASGNLNNLNIFVSGCYFSHHFECHSATGTGQMRLFFSNNSVDSLNFLTESPDNWNIKEWCNNLRNN